jgi:hypothetical protein
MRYYTNTNTRVWGEHSLAQIVGFREATDVYSLADLGFEGNSWTFEKRVAGGTFCRVRLDRALATVDCSARFPLATLRHIALHQITIRFF